MPATSQIPPKWCNELHKFVIGWQDGSTLSRRAAKGDGMDIGYAVLAMVVLVSGMLLAVQFKPPKKLTAKTEKFIHSFGQGIYGTFAAVAIMIAGFLYLVERQWSPRFSVDLKTRTMLLPVEGKEPHAVIQLFIAVQNRGRTVQKVKNIEVFADSLNRLTDLKNNRHGDLPGRNVYAFARLKT